MLATITYPDGHEEKRELTGLPAIGSPLPGPTEEGGITWKIAAVVRTGQGLKITAEAVAPPEWIHGDIEYKL